MPQFPKRNRYSKYNNETPNKKTRRTRHQSLPTTPSCPFTTPAAPVTPATPATQATPITSPATPATPVLPSQSEVDNCKTNNIAYYAPDWKDRTKPGWMIPDGYGNWQWCPGSTAVAAAKDSFIDKDLAYGLIMTADFQRRSGAHNLFKAMLHPSVKYYVSGGAHASMHDPLHFNVCILVGKGGEDVKKYNGQWHCYVIKNKGTQGQWSISECTQR